MAKTDILSIDFNNPSERDKVMEEHGDSKFPFFGTNDNGEKVMISISKESIVIETFQKNGWTRKNIYYYNDYTVEELFEK